MKEYFGKFSSAATVLVAVLFLLWPDRASAHLVTTGMGPVYDGIGHLLLTPEDIIPVVALAMLGGLQGADCCRNLLIILPLCWLLGGLAGFGGANITEFPVQAGSLLLIGLLVAGDVRLPVPVTAGIAVLFGLLHGFMNGVTLSNEPGILGLLGITIALFVIITIVSALVVSIAEGWRRVAVRVGGSWVAASGLLMFGWYLKAV